MSISPVFRRRGPALWSLAGGEGHDAWPVRFDTILQRGRARLSQLSKAKIRMEGTWNRTTRGVQDRRPETAASPGAAAAEGGPLHWQPAPCRWLQVWALRHTGQVPPGLGCRDSHVDPCAVSFQKHAPGPPFGPHGTNSQRGVTSLQCMLILCLPGPLS